MKFSDGNWMMQPGVRAQYPVEIYYTETDPHGATLTVPTRAIRHRGDTLGGPVLTLRVSSPLPDVLRVRVSHYEGASEQGPEFPLYAHDAPLTTETTDEVLTFTSGDLSVRFAKAGGWDMAFVARGKTLTRSGSRGMGYVETDKDGAFMHEQLTLGVGENVVGLGERFTAFVKNGQVVDMWNKDGGTGSDQAYKNVPFYLTNRGYGVFVNHAEAVSFEVASEKVSRVQFSVPGESLDYFVIYGPSPKEILQKYTQLTGRPPLPPAWSFGLWLTTSFTTSYDEKTVTGVLDEMQARDLPLSVFHFDCFWMRAFRWCDFEWNPETFPDPDAMLARLKARGLKICVWINSYIGQASPLFAEGKKHGYLLKRKNGDVWQWDMWQPGMAIVDFTNPDACAWFADKLRGLVAQGVDSFKTDFGERIPTGDVAWHDGSDPQKMHNFYPYLYNKVVFDVLRETKGENEAIVFARSATAGCQTFPVHWGGDCYSSFESMAETLRGGLSLGLSGFGFWSHDIGGFEGKPPIEVYKRWLQFGLLSSHSRLHGSSSYRVPWLFDEEAVDVLRVFTRLKHRLMPYLMAQARAACDTGVPVLRAMLIEFPHDPACAALDKQYMLGENLLVAPVFSADGHVEYYLPEGRWTHLLTGETKEGPKWYRETFDFMSLPLFVRPHSVLTWGAEENQPDYNFAGGVTLRAYQMRGGETVEVPVPTQTGETAFIARVRRDGNQLRADLDAPQSDWAVQNAGNGDAVTSNGETASLELLLKAESTK